MIYLILLFTILFFILAWRRLDLAVMFLIAALPAYLIRFDIFGLPSTILEAMIWVVFLAWLLKSYRYIIENLKSKIGYSLKIENYLSPDGGKLKINNRYPFDWEMVLLLLVALLAVGVAGFNLSALGIWKAYFFEPILFFIVILNVMKGEKGREKILWPLAISAFIVSALAIFQKFTGLFIDNSIWAAEGTRRVVSFFGYPNAVGLYLGPLVLVMMGWLAAVIARSRASGETTKQSLARSHIHEIASLPPVARNDIIAIIFISLTIIASVLSIYFAKSKGALLAVAAGLIVFGLLAGKKARWATAVIILIVAGGLLFSQPARRLAYETVTFKTLSGQIRLAGWSDAWRLLQDGRTLTGAGLANFQTAIKPYHTEGIFIKDFSDPDFQRKLVFNDAYRTAHWQPLEIYLYPHNIILNFWSELGLAGLLLFIWIIGKYFWLGISNLSLRGMERTQIPRYRSGQASQSRKQDDRGLLRSLQSLAMTDRYIVIGLISAMIAIVVHGLVDVPYFKNDLAVMFWLLVAMMSLINLENKYEKNI